MAECKTCIHYDGCLKRFRAAKEEGFYELLDEEEYFAHADECEFFYDTTRLIEVPVKPRDTIYTISRGKIKEWVVYYVGMNTLGHIMFNYHDKDLQNSRSACDADIGETVFLTEEDAINELKERKSYDNT